MYDDPDEYYVLSEPAAADYAEPATVACAHASAGAEAKVIEIDARDALEEAVRILDRQHHTGCLLLKTAEHPDAYRQIQPVTLNRWIGNLGITPAFYVGPYCEGCDFPCGNCPCCRKCIVHGEAVSPEQTSRLVEAATVIMLDRERKEKQAEQTRKSRQKKAKQQQQKAERALKKQSEQLSEEAKRNPEAFRAMVALYQAYHEQEDLAKLERRTDLATKGLMAEFPKTCSKPRDLMILVAYFTMHSRKTGGLATWAELRSMLGCKSDSPIYRVRNKARGEKTSVFDRLDRVRKEHAVITHGGVVNVY